MRASCSDYWRNTKCSRIRDCFPSNTNLDKLTQENGFVFLLEQLYQNNFTQSISMETPKATHFANVVLRLI